MRKHKKLIQVIALVLAALLVGGVVFGALYSALAETPEPGRDQYAISMEYLEDEQALRVEQRLVYVNRTGTTLDRVMFYAAPNMFRRRSALMYEEADLAALFPSGYVPGGMDLRAVRVDGAAADYGFQGENELYLRVACDLQPGETCAFEFEYYLLLTRCGAFIGAGDEDVRLSAFYLIPGVYGAADGEFRLNQPLPFTRWLYSEAGDYDVRLTLPDNYRVASVGEISGGNGSWRMTVRNAREFALSFSRRWRETVVDASACEVAVYGSSRNLRAAANAAATAVRQCAEWFGEGAFPFPRLTIAQSDGSLAPLNFPGYIQLPSRLFERKNAEALAQAIRFCVAQQYFGLSAYVEPSADAWLSDSVSEYIAYLLLEARSGQDAFLKAVNRDWVSALQMTIPGGLNVTSDAQRFDADEYDVVVRKRGAVVLHELRQAMGLEGLLDGLERFYVLGQDGRTLTEMDLVRCMDDATGRSWYDFLTDWAFNVGDYVNQNIDWFS